MTTRFTGSGNLGNTPTLTASVGDEQRNVADMRIYFDRPVKSANSDQYQDKGGFWLDVSAWDWLAEEVVRVLTKGMRVKVEGSMKYNTWTDTSTGETHARMVLYADDITLALGRIEQVTLRSKQPPHDAADR